MEGNPSVKVSELNKQGKSSGGSDIVTELSSNVMLPVKPVEPQLSDCCGTGCTPCVFDIYLQDLERCEKEYKRIKNGLPAKSGTRYSQVSAVTPSEYRQFRIESFNQDSLKTYVYRFVIPGGGLLGIKTGQHLFLRYFTDGKTLIRPYTPISDVMAEGYFDVMIKIYDDGQMSQYVRTWRIGDMIEWRGPCGNFTYTPNKWKRVLMLAAGTGIAPMAQVITTILNNEEDETMIRLCYACQNYEEILMKPAIDGWADYWNFSVTFFLSKDSPDRPCKRRYGDELIYSRIDQTLIDRELGVRPEESQVLICGTESFDIDMENFLRRFGIPEENYFKF